VAAPLGETRRLVRAAVLCECRRALSPLAALLRATDLPLREPARDAVVLAVGFGRGHLALDGLEQLPAQLQAGVSLHAIACDLAGLALMKVAYPDYSGLFAALEVCGRGQWTRTRVVLHRGDPRHTVLRLSGNADVMLLEPESVEALPTVFSLDFLRRLVRLLPPGGVLLSACSAPALRGALLRLGLTVGCCDDLVCPRGGTVAAREPARIRTPLPARERQEARESVAGIPYRDRALNWPSERLLRYRERVVERMLRRGMPADSPGSPGVSTEDAFA
jgi:hypothetical protein